MDQIEEQRREKYRFHDLVLEDVDELEFVYIKSNAVRKFVNTKESDQVKLILSAFMDYLTANQFRIVKKEKP